MPKAVFYVDYKLKKGASVEGFLSATGKLNDGYMSKQPGYISWLQLRDGEIWADYITFETLEDAKRVESVTEPDPLALDFYSYINLNSCRTRFYTEEKHYGA